MRVIDAVSNWGTLRLSVGLKGLQEMSASNFDLIVCGEAAKAKAN